MNKLVISLILSFILGFPSCDNVEKKNMKIVRSFIEFSNKGDTMQLHKLLSDDFDKETILLKSNLSKESNLIDKERIILDEIRIVDKNTIKTIEHKEDVYSDFFKLDMPKYEITYFVANSKIISITIDMDKARNKETLNKKIRHMELKISFNNWFSDKHPKFNGKDYLIENGLTSFLLIYSKLDSSELDKYRFKIRND